MANGFDHPDRFNIEKNEEKKNTLHIDLCNFRFNSDSEKFIFYFSSPINRYPKENEQKKKKTFNNQK